jgi:GNAT superfamily N-acetyltransferase
VLRYYLQHSSAPPVFAPRQDWSLADLAARHRALHDTGAVHLLATLDGPDAGLLTIELTSPAPRLCPDGQPCIGTTATLLGARGQGVGHALVDAALTWAHDHGHQWISVDFETANPLSRPFWLSAGFHPAGYGLLHLIDRGTGVNPEHTWIDRRPLSTDHCASRPYGSCVRKCSVCCCSCSLSVINARSRHRSHSRRYASGRA